MQTIFSRASSTPRTLSLLCLWAGLLFGGCPAFAQTFGVYRELWTGLNASSSDLGALTNAGLNLRWPDNPVAGFSKVFTNFETEINSTFWQSNYFQ